MTDSPDPDLIAITADLTSAYLNHNMVASSELPKVIQSIHAALEKAYRPPVDEAPSPIPAVPIRASIRPGYLVCLEDGKKLRMLKRYLRTHYQLTPEEYRAKWGLPRDYPMVAPDYAARRTAIAQNNGLGRKSIKSAGEAKAPADNDVSTEGRSAMAGGLDISVTDTPPAEDHPLAPTPQYGGTET